MMFEEKLHFTGRWATNTVKRVVVKILGGHFHLRQSTIEKFGEYLVDHTTDVALETELKELKINFKLLGQIREHTKLLKKRLAVSTLPQVMPECPLSPIKSPALNETVDASSAVCDESDEEDRSLSYRSLSVFSDKSRAPAPEDLSDDEKKQKGKHRGRKGPGRSGFFPPAASPVALEEFLKRGRHGEERFYKFLLEKAKQKWGDASIRDEHNGFKVYSAGDEQPVFQVVWGNKARESFEPLDMMVCYKGKEFILEVKSTKYPKKDFINISTREWENLVKHREHYGLVCVFRVEDDAHFDIIWNPFKKMAMNTIKPFDCVLRWNYTTREEARDILTDELNETLGLDEPEECGEECRLQ